MWQVYPTHDIHSTILGKNYSKFYEAFQQGVSAPSAGQTVAATAPAKRHSAAVSMQASKRRRQHDGTHLPQPEQHQASIASAQLSAATPTTALIGANPSDSASPSRESSIRPRPRSDSAAKGKVSKFDHFTPNPFLDSGISTLGLFSLSSCC